MANNNQGEGPNQDFLDQLLDMQNYRNTHHPNLAPPEVDLSGPINMNMNMMLQRNSPAPTPTNPGGFHAPPVFPLGLSLDPTRPTFLKSDEGQVPKRFPQHLLDSPANKVFPGQPVPSPVPVVPHQPAVRPRVRARRGQATDPHSIAERLRRERIAERIKALQDLVPSVNKTDKAAILDEIVDYVKFLRLQVKVLSMSRLGGAGAVVPLVTDIPISSVEEECGKDGQGQPVWEKWSNDGTERQVAKLLDGNVGAAMQFLQSKALCIMPISLASAIYHTQPPEASLLVKPESNPPQ